MRLVGSRTERDFRDNLIKSHKALFDGEYENLFMILQENFSEMKTAYFINHIPEQGEDIYTILVNNDIIATIEVSRVNHNERPIVEIHGVNDFNKGCSKIQQIKLAVAINLAMKDMEGTS